MTEMQKQTETITQEQISKVEEFPIVCREEIPSTQQSKGSSLVFIRDKCFKKSDTQQIFRHLKQSKSLQLNNNDKEQTQNNNVVAKSKQNPLKVRKFFDQRRYILIDSDSDNGEKEQHQQKQQQKLEVKEETIEQQQQQQPIALNLKHQQPNTTQFIEPPAFPIKSEYLGNGKFPSSQQSLKISCWNINGLARIEKTQCLTAFLKKHKPDILCLNETKITEENFKLSGLKNAYFSYYYFMYFNFVKANKGYSGVGILSKVKPIKVYHDLNKTKHDQEGRLITLEFDHLFLITTYVPNIGNKNAKLDYRVKEWDADFKQYLHNLKNNPKQKHVIWCGDMNVVHTKNDIHPALLAKSPNGLGGSGYQSIVNFNSILQETRMVDTFRKLNPNAKDQFTYWNYALDCRNNNCGTRLDYFICDQELMDFVEDSSIQQDVEGSDHCPISLTLDISKFKSNA